jgi:uncharacterized protein YbjT (DUF2867 family)
VKVLLFGATGLAGGGVLRACLAAPDVSEVRAVVRRSTGVRDSKLREIIHDNYLDYSAIANEFAGVDAGLFCLGISVTQVPDEAGYRRIHQAFPMAAAKLLRERSPAAVFHYLSGGRAALKSRWMWARVKAEAERDLMNDYAAVCWRPAMIGGTPGAPPPFYLEVLRPVLTFLFRPFKSMYIESDDIGRAMLEATRQGLRRRIFENPEMRDLAKRP